MFKIVSRYVYTDIFELIDSANCYDEALRLKYEYQSAFHNAYTIEIVEVQYKRFGEAKYFSYI